MTPSGTSSNNRSKPRSRLRVIGGLALLIVGLILAIPGVPGPGILTILVALVILSDHFVWARRALEWVRKKARGMGLPERLVPSPPSGDDSGGSVGDQGTASSKTEAV
jgi:hypothetical protein